MAKFSNKWEECELGQVVDVTSGYGFPLTLQGRKSGDIPFFKVGDISKAFYAKSQFLHVADHYVSNEDLKTLKAKVIPASSIVFAKIGEALKLNRRAILFKDSLIDNNVMALVPSENILSKYVFYFFLTQDLSSLSAGNAVPSVRKSAVEKIKVPVPTFAEQKRIVAKLDKLFAHHDKLKARLEKVPELLKQFRQAVLTQAVTGKLTEEWRIKSNNGNLPSGLDKIKYNRLKSYKERFELAKATSAKPPKRLDESEFDFFVYENEYELPQTWELANLKNIADLITDGEHATPRRTTDGYYLLSARNVQDGFVSLDKVDYVPEDEYRRLSLRCNPQYKDVLISCSGTIGRVSLVPEGLEFVMVRSAALLKFQSNKDSSKFIELALRSELAQEQIRKLQKATAQANLFIGPIGQIVVPIPSIEEQKEIVRSVESLFALADKIEARYSTLKEKTDHLPQAILAKAFRGELTLDKKLKFEEELA